MTSSQPEGPIARRHDPGGHIQSTSRWSDTLIRTIAWPPACRVTHQQPVPVKVGGASCVSAEPGGILASVRGTASLQGRVFTGAAPSTSRRGLVPSRVGA